ncbi:PilZ domain-containing protein [Rhodopseudomonas sp. HC1]|uniref:PilZ domain-containing protein n=1 Tax=Rhodopseudomonas infernalis TaxID=2897386 RepID=UPI001EE83959|nr:PilZ domain-containing protein [Rhodopseudomonas infernalis]MCG6207765.1 PilZ domain-containing protein [Rhodopseudomonas infernalis]
MAAIAGSKRTGNRVDDNRRSPRHGVEEPAHVSFNGVSLGCLVVNLSEEGAALEVEQAAYIPQRFRLVTSSGVRECRLVWIKQTRIGVMFEI